MNVGEICDLLAELAPLGLAETWDNVGLLVGDRGAPVRRIMTCLTVTPAVIEEAASRRVDLVITHHPLPFKPVAKITTDSSVGAMLISLIAGEIAVYSAHTAFDSATDGINQTWAERLGAHEVGPLIANNAGAVGDSAKAVGSGRHGILAGPVTIDQLARTAAGICGANDVRVVGNAAEIWRVAIACGSGGSFLQAAAACGCQAMITGEATYHTCLEAEALGVNLVLVGHFASERFAMVKLADDLQARFAANGNECDAFASENDLNPLRTIVIRRAED